MKKNMGTLDRGLRFLGALIIILLYVSGQITGTAAIVLGIIAALLLATSLMSFCPLYPLLGISTKSKEPGTDQA